MKSFRKRLEDTANKALVDKLLELERQNAAEIKIKIDDFTKKTRAWIREEVQEALREAENVKESLNKGNKGFEL